MRDATFHASLFPSGSRISIGSIRIRGLGNGLGSVGEAFNGAEGCDGRGYFTTGGIGTRDSPPV